MEKVQLKAKGIKGVENLLFLGLILSENYSLVNFYGLFTGYHAPIFTIIFSSLATLAALCSLVSQIYTPERGTAAFLEFFQALGLMCSKTILITLINTEDVLSTTTLFCLTLFLVQSLVVLAKIVYLGSVLPGQIAQTSTLVKLLRIIKINLFAILPLFLESQAIFVSIFAIFQLCQAFLFCFKFTYQQSSIEYILMIGIIGGLVSSIQAIISLMLGIPHFLLGQSLMLGLFFMPGFPSLHLLEIKYLRILQVESLRQDSQTILIMFRFMRECLFQEESTIQFSKQTKGKCWLLFLQLLKMKNAQVNQAQNTTEEADIWSQFFIEKTLAQKQFFQVLCKYVNQKSHFQSFAFKVECALKLKSKYIKYSLIMYYQFTEKVKNNLNVLEKSKIQRIYNQISKTIYEKKSDLTPAYFITFDKLLENLRGKVKECITFEIELIKCVGKQKKANNQYSDTLLVKRNELKESVNDSLLNLLKNDLYVNSNQFKYLFLLFHLSILKEPQLMVSLIKTYFSCKEATQKMVDSTFDYFIILDGSNNGEILNCNQNFKNKFKLNSQLIYNDKGTINKLFPTVVQAKTHIQKMSSSQTQVAKSQQVHCDFDCLIVVQKYLQDFKFNSLQPFTISTRIFYQNSSGFNYICQFLPLHKSKNGRVTLHINQYQKLKKLLKASLKFEDSRRIIQLEEQIQIVDIYIEELNEELSKNQEDKLQQIWYGLENDRDRQNKNRTNLQEKLDIIQKKIIQTKQEYKYKWSNYRILEVGIFFAVLIILVSSFLVIQNRIDLLKNTNSQKNMVKDACLKRNKIMLSHLIMQLLSSSLYPSDFCSSYLTDFPRYLRDDMSKDLTDGFDSLLDLAVMKEHSSKIISSALYNQADYSQTYLTNFQGNISFIKYIHLFKASFLQYLGQEQPPMGFSYYSQNFPQLLKNYSFSGRNSPYPLINIQTEQMSRQLLGLVIELKPVICALFGVLILAAIVLRMLDTQQILDYISILQNSPYAFLKQRQKQLSYTRNLLQRLRYSYIYEIQIEEDTFNVRSNQKLLETINDQTVFRKNVQAAKVTYPKITSCEEEEIAFLGNKNKIAYADITISSRFQSLLVYNKSYLIITFSLVLISLFWISNFLNFYFSSVSRIYSFDKVSAKMSQIEQNYINLVASNWLKTTSMAESFDLTATNQLFNDSITFLQNADYQNTVFKYYPRQAANQILYEDVCQYLPNTAQCNQYRNGVFNSGSSVLLPLTINQELQIELFYTNFSHYWPNLCDKTFLLYRIVVQFEKRLPLISGQNFLEEPQALKQLSIFFSVGLLLVLSLIWQAFISKREHIMLKELLSLDYVENLYVINEFKPLFNKIFYK